MPPLYVNGHVEIFHLLKAISSANTPILDNAFSSEFIEFF